jgi:hypothetical protein
MQIPEPPQAFDFPQLFFVGDAAEEFSPLSRLSCSYKTGVKIPADKLEWPVCVTPSAEGMNIKVNGIDQVPGEVYLFWVRGGLAKNLKDGTGISLSASEQPTYGYIVATANPADMALYTNQFIVGNNYPNPFNRATSIEFSVPYEWEKNGMRKPGEMRKVSLAIYNVAGRKVVSLLDGNVAVGNHKIEWTGADNSGRQSTTGFYFARVKSGTFSATVKMLRVR